MPQVRRDFMEAWLRLMGMKLYQRRATDYFRSASADVRDVIAAKG
jgi:acyl-CoA dehydrogenase